jgi:2-polyprenyl-3-methyl-5-hydroxy-6-metoxy-1,4-benzoquinol methylase
MDDPALDAARHRQALAGLARINRVAGTVSIVWREIAILARELGAPLTVLDVASGAGDTLMAIGHKAQRKRLDLELHGMDISPTAVAMAQERAAKRGLHGCLFKQADILHTALARQYDVVMCSLFLHHLSDQDAVRLLTVMRDAARRLVLVSDLRRTGLGYAMAWLGARLLSRSPIVHNDAPVSVEAAFTSAEALALAQQAGLPGATVHNRWPQRFLMRWRRT